MGFRPLRHHPHQRGRRGSVKAASSVPAAPEGPPPPPAGPVPEGVGKAPGGPPILAILLARVCLARARCMVGMRSAAACQECGTQTNLSKAPPPRCATNAEGIRCVHRCSESGEHQASTDSAAEGIIKRVNGCRVQAFTHTEGTTASTVVQSQ